jgi:gas vesicle protein
MTKGKFGLGLIVGAIAVVTGLLTAPKSGEQTRADLKQRADGAKSDAEKKAKEVKDKAQTVADEAKHRAETYKDKTERAVKSAKEAFNEEAPNPRNRK